MHATTEIAGTQSIAFETAQSRAERKSEFAGSESLGARPDPPY